MLKQFERHTWLIPIAIVLVAAALRFYHLGDKGLWGDEIAQAKWSLLPLVKLWSRFRDPPDFLLHFTLVQLAEKIGSSAFWVRLPSAMTSVLVVPAAFVLARRIAGYLPALLTMFLVAVAPFQIWYAQDARMYAPMTLYTVLALYLLVRLIEKPDWRAVTGLAIANALGLYNHFFGAMTIGIEIVAAAGIYLVDVAYKRGLPLPLFKRLVPPWLLPLGLALGLSLLLISPLVAGTLPYLQHPVTTSTFESRFDVSGFQLTRQFVLTLLTDFGLGPDANWRTLLTVFLALVGLGWLVNYRTRYAWVVGVWLCLPLAILGVSQPERVVAVRYLIFLQPAYLFLCALGVAAVIGTLTRWLARADKLRAAQYPALGTVGAVFLLAIIVFAPLQALYARAKLNDWQTLARYLNSHAEPGDMFVGEKDFWAVRATGYYLPNPNAFSSPPGTIKVLTQALAQKRRIWYVSFGGFLNPAEEAWVKQHFAPVPLQEWSRPELVYRPTDGFRYPQSEELFTLYRSDGIIPSQISYTTELGDRGSTTPWLPLNAGETLTAKLQRDAPSHSVLRIDYSSKSAVQFDVIVNDKPIAQVRKSQVENGTQTAQWTLSKDAAQVVIQVRNIGGEYPLFVKQIALESE